MKNIIKTMVLVSCLSMLMFCTAFADDNSGETVVEEILEDSTVEVEETMEFERKDELLDEKQIDDESVCYEQDSLQAESVQVESGLSDEQECSKGEVEENGEEIVCDTNDNELESFQQYDEEELLMEASYASYSTDVTKISFSATDLISGKSFNLNGNSGRPAVYLFGGLSSCPNTMSAIDLINLIVDRTDVSKYDIYLFDTRSSDSVDSIKKVASDYNWYGGLHVAKYNDSNSEMSSLYWSCLTNYTLNNSYIMPLIVYKNSSGKLSAGSTDAVTEENIIGNLNKIGVNVVASSASDKYELYKVKYNQNEARSMVNMINSFRTSSDAWYWEIDNNTKVKATASELFYDKNLEAIAMLRAAELAKSYSHTRPNGKRCFSAYNLINYGYMACGENIARGYNSATDVFRAWREDNEKYEGQGHRRNMLSDQFYAVGIGHCVYNGVHYWVQEFASPYTYTSGNSKYIDTSVLNDYADVRVYTSGVGTFSIVKASSFQAGWKQDSIGWWYQNSDGTYPKNCWKLIDGKWYHFNERGYMQTGWLIDGGKWYYLEASGAMASNKWINNTYYVKSNGVMAISEWVDNGKYFVDENGKWVPNKQKYVEGWKKNTTGWWYQNCDGTYPKNCWKQIGGIWYHFNGSGYMQTGWLKDGNNWFYLKVNGAMASNEWVENIYYMKSNGAMAVSEWVDGGRYFVDGNGRWVPGKTR